MKLIEKYKQLDDQKKALAKMIGIVLAIVLIFILIIAIMSIIKGGKKTNAQIELIMTDAAKEYVADHKDEVLKDQVYGSTEVDVNTLAEQEYMKPFTKYYGKETTCTGKVLIYKNLEDFDYIPKIDCGESYKTKSIYEEITNKKNIVTEQSGLYEYEDKYVYRGEYVDNYVSFAGAMWRIINIDKNGEIKIFQDSTEKETIWDNRYNADFDDKVGINLFETTDSSRIKETILALYNNESIFPSSAKSHIIPKEYCAGKRSSDDTTKDYSVECSVKTELMGAATFVVADFLNASIDPNCVKTTSTACSNYNYLAKLKRTSWTMTADTVNTKRAFSFSDRIYSRLIENSTYLRLVVTVNGNINYTSGDGTYDNPYVIG